MRLLDRYLLRELLIPLGYCLGGFFIFWVSSDLLSELSTFQSRNLAWREVLEYYVIRTPEMLATVLPVGLLLALLYALTNHARHQELTAIRAAGLGLWRIAVPYLVVGAVCSLALFASNEWLVPDGNEAAQAVLDRHTASRPDGSERQWRRNLTFHNERDRRIWNIGAYNRDTGEMLAANVEWVERDGARRRLTADHVIYTNETWVFYGVRELLYLPLPDTLPVRGETNELSLAQLTETPAQINSEIKYSELSNFRLAKRPRLSLREILDYQRLHPYLNSTERAKLRTQFHGRLAEPWTCLVVVLIAVPFGAPSGRRNVFVGVAGSIFIGFAYFILLRFGLALGTGGYLAPWLAAWLPNTCFALAGIVLMRRVR